MTRPAAAEPIHVWFALLRGSLALDWAGPAEALRSANTWLADQGEPERFVLHFTAPQPTLTSSVGLQLSGLEPLPASLPVPSWVVVVGMTGKRIDVADEDALSLLHWLRGLRLVAGRLELLTVCAGAVLAAHAGLLAGRRATTHHQHLDELAATEPRCDVVANRVFVSDGASTAVPAWPPAWISPCTASPKPAVRRLPHTWRKRWCWRSGAGPKTRSSRPFWTTATTCTRRCTVCRTPWPRRRSRNGASRPWPPSPALRRAT
jgi:hypothetical protein